MGWRTRALTALVLIAPVCASAAPPVGEVNFPPDTIKAETRFDSASRLLGMRCISAVGGTCRFIIDDAGVRHTVMLRPRASKTVKIKTADAKMCVIGIDPAMPCKMIPVEPVEFDQIGR